MPVFAVKSFGVSDAMSFICGLSTMATLIEPPLELVAGDPPELSEPPPQPTATAPVTASRAAADPSRRVPLISSLLRLHRGGDVPPRPSALIALIYVGCQVGLSVLQSRRGSLDPCRSEPGAPGGDRRPRRARPGLRPVTAGPPDRPRRRRRLPPRPPRRVCARTGAGGRRVGDRRA